MKTLALLSIYLALPLAAQTPDAKAAPPSASQAPVLPRDLTSDEQINILLDLVDAQQAWLNQLNNLAAHKGTFDDQTITNDATAKYQAAVAAAKAAASAKDTAEQIWNWNFKEKKWIAQPAKGQ